MALRKIALQGEPCLTKVCRPVTEFNDRLHVLLDDLADTLEDSGGVGLAAPQVGVQQLSYARTEAFCISEQAAG